MSQEQEGKKDNESKDENEQVDFHGAAIVDKDGNEIEITESMVRKAIHDLEPEAYPEIEDEDFQ